MSNQDINLRLSVIKNVLNYLEKGSEIMRISHQN